MEHSQKNTDCYFFYYSTCLKGDGCAFRHEPSALGCETMCSYWLQGNCLNEHCNFRHMELKKNRKSIACYWETQPGGCRKPHCCFMHKNTRPATTEPNNPVRNSDPIAKPVNQEWSNRQDDGKYDSDPRTTLDGSSTESDQGRGGSEAGSFIGSPAVDPLVVNFEEESDNESVPSPTKPQLRMLHVKTLEEIKLERIQAESAAYYNYSSEDIVGAHLSVDRSILIEGSGTGTGTGTGVGSTTLERNLRARLANRLYTQGTTAKANLDFQVLSLDEIRKRRRRMPPTSEDSSSREKMPRLGSGDAVSSSTSSSASAARNGFEIPEHAGKLLDDKSELLVVRGPRAAVTAAAPPPVRLRRSNRTMIESLASPRKKIPRYSGGEQEPPEMTSSDSSQDAAAVPDRLMLVATRPSLSARDDRNDRSDGLTGNKIAGVENVELAGGNLTGAETRLQERNGLLLPVLGEPVINGGPALRTNAARSTSIPSLVSEEDYLMMDATSGDQSAAADDILQDIDELLNDD